MTLNELEQDCYRRLNKSTAPDTSTQARLRAFLNQRHRELLTLADAQQLRDGVTTFASVANQAYYGLPQAVARVNRLWQADNEVTLREETLDWYRTIAPDPTIETGDPEVFVVAGRSPVAAQPASANSVSVSSTAAGDTTQQVTLRVVTTGGYQETIGPTTLTGTTLAQIGSRTDIIGVEDVWLSAACAGRVTVTGGGGETLAVFPIGATRVEYWGIYLWPTPASVLTYSLDYTRRIADMAVSTDVPLLPEDFHRLLVYGACADEALHMDDQRYQAFKGEWVAGVSDLKYWLHARPSYRPGVVQAGGGSNLGVWYPPGRW